MGQVWMPWVLNWAFLLVLEGVFARRCSQWCSCTGECGCGKSSWDEQALCSALLEPDLVGWAGKTNYLQQEVLPELRIPCGKTWLLWECRREAGREFLFACFWGLASLLSQLCWKGLVQTSPLVLQSCLRSHGAGGCWRMTVCRKPSRRPVAWPVSVPSEKNGFIAV